jgi:hypothetical protein
MAIMPMCATFESINPSIHPSIDLQTFKFHQMHQILVAHNLKTILDIGLKNSSQIGNVVECWRLCEGITPECTGLCSNTL